VGRSLNYFSSTEELDHVPNDHRGKPGKQTIEHEIHRFLQSPNGLSRVIETDCCTLAGTIFAANTVQLNGRVELISMERPEAVFEY
jgi:hypothetical protein